MKPKNKRIVSRRTKLLALFGGLVIVVLVITAIRIIIPVQLKTNVVPDPMAYFKVIQDGQNAHMDIKKQHAAVWIVRRSAFLPILDVSKVAPDLRTKAETYNGEMSARLESAISDFSTSQSSPNRTHMHPLSVTFHKDANLFQKQVDYYNPEFKQVWKEFCLLLRSIQDFRSVGRTGWVIFQGKDGSKLVLSEDLGQRAESYLDKLPEEIVGVIKEWKAVVEKISSKLLEAPADFSESKYSESAQLLKEAEKAYQEALSDFLPKFLGNDEYLILPCGIESWFETISRAQLALYVSNKEWIRAAWTCHDDLKDDRLFAHYLKKAGLKGRLILAQETVEDEASNLGESIKDVIVGVPK